MRIQNNISSLNAWRNLTSTDNSLGKSLERLSSGFRINKAADDAAGLAISEKMRAQIRGMNQAIRNAQDGISLVQTAEGALNESHVILQRMRELSVQAANGTNTGADRNKIQSEMDELSSEITRITNTTRYNAKELINGSMQAVVGGVGGGTGELNFQIGPLANQQMSFSVAAMDAQTLGVARDMREVQDNYNLLNTVGVSWDRTTGFADGNYEVTVTYDGNNYFADVLDKTTGASVLAAASLTADADGDTVMDSMALQPGQTVTFTDAAGDTLQINFDNDLQKPAAATALAPVTFTAEIQIARADATQFNGGYKTADAVTIAGLDVTTEANATAAITALDNAINTVASQRAQLGAMQNRLEHTINNLSVVSENLTASESRIRDVDMASEMATFTKQQILMQAGTAMLAQANSKNQAVLQLLQ